MRRRGNTSELAFWETVDNKLIRAVSNHKANTIPEELLQQKETAQLVSIALTNLPVRYQMALRRRYFEDLSLHEIAALEKCSEGAIKVLLHRARQAFRDAFETISTSILEKEVKGRMNI
jgi:RNA polymerase sigma-70 factor (ECF subfamily)